MAVSRQTLSAPPGAGGRPSSAPAGSWTTVSASALTYDWTLVDLASGAVVDRAARHAGCSSPPRTATVAGFAVTGFGCDGKAFNLDAVRASGSTFDFEGVSLSTSVAAGGSR